LELLLPPTGPRPTVQILWGKCFQNAVDAEETMHATLLQQAQKMEHELLLTTVHPPGSPNWQVRPKGVGHSHQSPPATSRLLSLLEYPVLGSMTGMVTVPEKSASLCPCPARLASPSHTKAQRPHGRQFQCSRAMLAHALDTSTHRSRVSPSKQLMGTHLRERVSGIWKVVIFNSADQETGGDL
jgi:hypothetical protein